MKLEETKAKSSESHDMRYQVTLYTDISGTQMFWRTRVTAMSPQQALVIAQELFKKHRARFQEAMLRKWDISDITPLVKKNR